jgi:biopolymer transport protein ExbD
MRAPLVKKGDMVSRINVTPIIDVALVLVIILLITAPILSVADFEIDLPQAHTRGREDPTRILITLGQAGELAVDDETVSWTAFEAVLGARLDGIENDVLVVVRADRGTAYDQVESILGRARNAGAVRLAIATRQKGKETP